MVSVPPHLRGPVRQSLATVLLNRAQFSEPLPCPDLSTACTSGLRTVSGCYWLATSTFTVHTLCDMLREIFYPRRVHAQE